MNKYVKYIPYGVIAFVFILVVLSVARSLIVGQPILDAFKEWTNWLIAVAAGVSTSLTIKKKDMEKGKEKEKETEDPQ